MESPSSLVWSLVLSVLISAVPLLIASLSYVFFIVAALAIARSRLSRLEELEENGGLGASTAIRVLDSSENYLLCAQVGRFLSAVGAGFLLAIVMRDAPPALAAAGMSSPLVYGPIFTVTISIVFVGITLVLVQVAKSLSIHFPESALCAVALPLRLAYMALGPIVLIVHGAVSQLLEIFNVRRVHEGEMALSTDDLSELVRRGSEAGSIDKEEQALFEGVVELSERIAREVMTPRKDVVYVRETSDTSDLVKLFTQHAVSRLLVCRVDLDDVKGIVLAKDLLRFIGQQVDAHAWRQFLRPAYFIPNTKPVDDLLSEMRSRGVHMAVVLDEHGGVDGIVTLEDLMEEIVGEIFDEHDHPSDQQEVVTAVDGSVIVDGGVLVSRLAEDYGMEFPEGEYDTVAGFVLAHLGRVPAAGDTLTTAGFSITVVALEQNRVVRVAIRPENSAVPDAVLTPSVSESLASDDELVSLVAGVRIS